MPAVGLGLLLLVTLSLVRAGDPSANLPANCGSLGSQDAALLAAPWANREASLQAHGRLPPACLQALVRQCLQASEARFLDGGSAALCSVRYEALLRHGFEGDFEALMAWWRRQRETAR